VVYKIQQSEKTGLEGGWGKVGKENFLFYMEEKTITKNFKVENAVGN